MHEKCMPAHYYEQRCDLHLWRVALDESLLSASALERILDRTEVARASRFLRAIDRRRYIVRRAAVRMILSSYLDISPVCVRLESDDHGKPRLGDDLASSTLRFNVSSAGGLALCAVGFGAEIGVDVVSIDVPMGDSMKRPRFRWAGDGGAARRTECETSEDFLRGWVRTEAQLKACGQGLAGMNEAIGKLHPDWAYYDLALGPRYMGALVTKQANRRVGYYTFNQERR